MATPKLEAQAGKLTMVIEQGTTFSPTMSYKDDEGTLINLTGYTARMQVRSKKTSSTTLEDFTTENGGITLGGIAGTITINKSATDTAAISYSKGVYDLELISSGGIVTRLLEGSIVVSGETTR